MWTFASKAVPLGLVAIVSIAAARFLGPQDFGRQSFIAFAEISIIYLLSGGLPLALSRFTAAAIGQERPDWIRPFARTGMRISIAASAVGGLTLLGVGVAGAEPKWAWILAGAVASMSLLQRIPSALLIGTQSWRRATTPGLVTGAVGTVAVLIVLAAGGRIVGMFAVEAAVGVVLLVWITVITRRLLRETARGDAADAPVTKMLRFAGVTSVTVVLTYVVWQRSEFYFLNHYSTDAEIGFYAIAFSAVTMLAVLPDALGNAFLPAIATLHGAGASERIALGYARTVRLLVLAALPLTAACVALGPKLVELVYGSSYARAGTVLVILIAPFPVIALMNVSTATLSGIGRIVPPVLVGVLGTIVNLSLDFLLIPRYDAVGAAIANVSAQLTAAALIITLASRSVGAERLGLPQLLRVAVAAAIGGAVARSSVVVLGGAAGVAVGLLAGGAVFLIGTLLMRGVLREDVDWLETTSAAPAARLIHRLQERFSS